MANEPDGTAFVRLADLVEIEHGMAFKGEYFVDVPTSDLLVTPGNFAIGGGFDASKAKYYDGPVDDRYVLRPGDLLVTMTDLSRGSDTLGSPAVVPQSDQVRYLHNQRIGRVRVTKPEVVDVHYLYAALRTEAYRQAVVATATGTTVRHTSPTRIREVSIPLPSLREQRAIASVLMALDDKIESDNRLSRLLSQVNRLELSALLATATKQGCLADVAEIVMGQSPPGSTYSGEAGHGPVMVQGMGGFGPRHPREDVFTSQPTKLVGAGTTLMTVRAPVGAVNITDRETVCGRGVAGFVSDTPAFTEYLIRWLEPQWGEHETGTIFAAVNGKQIAAMPVPLPDEDLVRRFEKQVGQRVALINGLEREQKALRSVRKALLPKMLSGQVRVRPFDDPRSVVSQAVDRDLQESNSK